ncbi:tRNA (cytidine(34)-2'-O)-methyltransferase [Oceanispirochaeta sp.]|jgi:tRNA (cytidine/uridine-2'-O-)-methyltransferase|uniref:tRNA (cytidine(34)-2'-O)-methyltransferase n=1 Tax=Oceanispirochaeta sp. TaxID=2035350 RepID=UPI0026292B29|nr:tRNA (cytidine(34)-2'-O)-methyltransferase [Oceanispirochaeta sp.]MDA3958517.1 tRNA (cytidine(34)-2'-O)-methyltransferase [Oceanispirochaeta sp.]
MSLNIVLHEPEIPQNTGNIARTCAATGAALHLIEPLGFSIDEKAVRRAGLDYWSKLSLFVYASIEDFFEQNSDGPYFFCTTKAKNTYADVSYPSGAYLIFGKESKGIPEEILGTHPGNCIRIPMKEEIRSLNLSNAVAIITYEALKQQSFHGMELEGELHNLSWEESLSQTS